MTTYVRAFEAQGIYDRFDIPRMEFQQGVNILHGRNGTGKTTALHILANVLNGDYRRFAHLAFRTIRTELGDGSVIEVTRQKRDEDTVIASVAGQLVAEFAVKDVLQRVQPHFSPDTPLSIRETLLEEAAREEAAAIIPNVGTAYFPAFRTMIEAWSSLSDERYQLSASTKWRARVTRLAREWFGEFVPSVNFPTLVDIQRQIGRQVDDAKAQVWRADRNLLTKAFLDIFKALSEGDDSKRESASAILQQVRSLFDRLEATPLKAESMILTGIYDELRSSLSGLEIGEEAENTAIRVLSVYRQMLEGIVSVQEGAFEEIQRYLASVNEFLEGKGLVVNTSEPRNRAVSIGIRFADNSTLRGLRALSSGERQIITLIYAATHMSEQRVVLIDEPEISLHVDWQTKLLPRMADQLGDRQIIACTHSPVIGEDYEDRLQKLVLVPTRQKVETQDLKSPNEQVDEEDLP